METIYKTNSINFILDTELKNLYRNFHAVCDISYDSESDKITNYYEVSDIMDIFKEEIKEEYEKILDLVSVCKEPEAPDYIFFIPNRTAYKEFNWNNDSKVIFIIFLFNTYLSRITRQIKHIFSYRELKEARKNMVRIDNAFIKIKNEFRVLNLRLSNLKDNLSIAKQAEKENAQNAQNAQDIQNAQNAQDIQNAQNAQNAQETQDTQNT